MARYIDAEELMKRWYELSQRGRTEFDQVIMTQPTADVKENVRGEWVLHKKPYMRECSNCKVWFHFDMPRNSFCPNCGADMRGGDET